MREMKMENDLCAMNSTQQEVIFKLAEKYLAAHSYGDKTKYEIKTFKTTKFEGSSTISLILEVGMIGDEGTYAETFARSRDHYFIRKRGGISIVSKKSKRFRDINVGLCKAANCIY